MILYKLISFNLIILYAISLNSQNASQHFSILAHAHNDYEQTEPIKTALDHGFDALEVDLFLYKGRLVISHDDEELEKKASFTEGYLNPLLKALDTIHELKILLIDIKNYSPQLLDRLNNELSPHANILLDRKDGQTEIKKLQIILSGEIPRSEIIKDNSNQFLFVDGRIDDLQYEYSKKYMPWISMDFTDFSNWKGKHKACPKTKKKLNAVITKVHNHNKLLRFWKTSETELMWETLSDLGIDIIGTDEIEHFNKAFLKD